MSFFVYTLTALCGACFGRSRFVFVAMLFVMWAFYSFNYENGDYLTYKFFYDSRTFDMWGVELLFGGLAHAAKYLQLNYAQFQIVIASITIFLLGRFIVKTVASPALVLLVFFVFFFPLDYVLMRNFLAFAIILQGVSLKLRGEKNSTFWYVFFVIVATFVHQSSIFYLMFLFSFSRRRIDLDSFVCAFILAGVLYLALRGFFIYLGWHASRLEMYGGTGFMFLLNVIIYTFNFIVVRFFLFSRVAVTADVERLKVILFNINLTLFVLLIPSYDIPILIRVLRHCLFINLVVMYLIIFYQGRSDRYQIAAIVAQLVFLFAFFIVPVYSDSLGAMLQHNSFFEGGL